VHGALGDRISPRAVVAGGLAASAMLNALFGASSAYAALLVLWGLNGWAQSAGWGPIVRTLSGVYGPEQRGRITAAFAPCSTAGHAVSWALAGWLVASAGWRAAFRVPAVLLAGAAVFWFLLVPRVPGDRAAPAAKPAAPLRESLGALARMLAGKDLRWAVYVCVFSGMLKDALTLWTPTWLAGQGLPAGTAAAASLLVPVLGVAGSAVAGALLQRRGAHSESVVVGMLGLAAAGGAAVLALAGSQVAVGLAGLGVVAAACYGINAMMTTAIPLGLGSSGQISGLAGALDFASYVGGGLGVALVGAAMGTLGWGTIYGAWVALGLAMSAMCWRARAM